VACLDYRALSVLDELATEKSITAGLCAKTVLFNVQYKKFLIRIIIMWLLKHVGEVEIRLMLIMTAVCVESTCVNFTTEISFLNMKIYNQKIYNEKFIKKESK